MDMHSDDALIQEIAEMLCLQATPDTVGWRLHGEDGMVIRALSQQGRNDRLEFRPTWRHLDGYYMTPGHILDMSEIGQPAVSISVAKSRGAQVIVNDVNRRLLCHYERLWPLVQRAIRRREEDNAKLRATMRQLADLAGDTRDLDPVRGERIHFYNLGGCTYGDLSLRSDGKAADVKFHGVPVPIAIQMLQLVKSQSDDAAVHARPQTLDTSTTRENESCSGSS
ncbi:hypothetical protein [Cupriavidus metallidurans]|uniref:hypothetical protein n=1 Tax=Cupriavidus metallidurans TaxID=119219 RepID=UPI001CCAF3A0|nr:hypothetical protein [Cupriavidus metallidurans]UBM12805.1 hypothetical protein LAI70_28030 [Cupriavidus metallidurans]